MTIHTDLQVTTPEEFAQYGNGTVIILHQENRIDGYDGWLYESVLVAVNRIGAWYISGSPFPLNPEFIGPEFFPADVVYTSDVEPEAAPE